MDEGRRGFLRAVLAGTIGGAALSAAARQASGEVDPPFLRGGRGPPRRFSFNLVRDNSSALQMDRK